MMRIQGKKNRAGVASERENREKDLNHGFVYFPFPLSYLYKINKKIVKYLIKIIKNKINYIQNLNINYIIKWFINSMSLMLWL
jgi:hypothetical protein